MNEFEYLEKSKNEIITIDSLNKKNDCFIRYLFSDEGNENIVLDFINGVMIDLNFQTFNNVVILNPSPTAGFSLFLFKLSMVIMSFLLFSKYSNSSIRCIITE